MSIRNTPITELLNHARFYIIKTPVNSSWFIRSSIKHMAVLDCKKKIIIEGLKGKDGHLDLTCSCPGETLEKYIKHREKTVGFNFSEDDISYEPIETIQNRKFHIPYYHDNPDYPCFNVCENEIEQRWLELENLELENLPEKYKKYDIEGKEGANCEMVAYYIRFGEDYTPNGKIGGYFKKIRVLNRFGHFNSSKD